MSVLVLVKAENIDRLCQQGKDGTVTATTSSSNINFEPINFNLDDFCSQTNRDHNSQPYFDRHEIPHDMTLYQRAYLLNRENSESSAISNSFPINKKNSLIYKMYSQQAILQKIKTSSELQYCSDEGPTDC